LNVYEEAVKTWGFKSQIDMAIEECSELITALRHCDRGKITAEAVCDEVADVEIMMAQLRVMLGDSNVEMAKSKKINRLIKRVLADRPQSEKEKP